MTSTPLEGLPRSQWAKAGLRSLGTVTALLVLYYVIPVAHSHEDVALRLAVALALFVSVLAYEVRAIQQHPEPMLRAGVAMASLIPLFLILFAWIYLTMSQSDPSNFSMRLDHTEALYFTVTIFSTVGFGDIAPKVDVARLVVMVQMIADLAFIAIVVRLIFGAASRATSRR